MSLCLNFWNSYVISNHKAFESLLVDIKAVDVERFVSEVFNVQDFICIKNFQLSENSGLEFAVERANGLINLSKEIDFPGKLIDSAFQNGFIEVDSVVSNFTAKCSRNFFVLSQFNFLEFQDQDFKFYIIQRVKFAEIIWIPSANLVLTIKDDNYYKIAVKSFLTDFLSHLKSTDFKVRSNAAFGGLISSFKRPFHYFYQVLSGVQAIKKHSATSSRIDYVYSETAGRFLNIPRVFNFEAEESVHDDSFSLTSHLLKSNRFAISSVFDREKDFYDDVEDAVVNYAINEKSFEEINGVTSCGSKKLKFLFSVMLEGRTWIEQVDGISEIVNELSKKYSNFAVFIDGLTSPEGFKNFSHPDLPKYFDVFRMIKLRIPESVEIHNIIGFDALTKVKICLDIDYFMTDMATSSMFVSRFAKVRGIGHCNSVMNYSMHRHFDIFRIPIEYVKDLDVGNQFRISYSMNPSKVSNFFFEKFNDRNGESKC